ncbi:MAG: hypothetical protein U0793_19960 [Gemmataceae bacterium]
MNGILNTLHSLIVDLGTLVGQLFSLALAWSLLLIWTAWWLWGVNWSKMGDALRHGAWAPVALLLLVAALVWSRLAPEPCRCLGIGNFWWQLGAVGLLAGYTLFLGWLQGVFGWAPTPINLDPPPIGTDIQHPGHGHHEAEPHPAQEHHAAAHGSASGHH